MGEVQERRDNDSERDFRKIKIGREGGERGGERD